MSNTQYSNVPYENLGNLSAIGGSYSVQLWCDKCKVQWIGCAAAAECPRCGGHEVWDGVVKDWK